VVQGGWKGRWKEGQKEGRRRGRGRQPNNRSPSLIRWRLVSRVKRKESFRVRKGFRKGFIWF
jgi:hypothetical protein